MPEEIKKYATYLHDKKTNEDYQIRDAEAIHQGELHPVAHSGSYNDLIDKPALSIPALPAELENNARYTLAVKVMDGSPVLYWAKLEETTIPDPVNPGQTVNGFVAVDDDGTPLTFAAYDDSGEKVSKICYIEEN